MVLKGWLLLMVNAEDYFGQMYDLYVRAPGMLYSMYLFFCVNRFSLKN